MGWIAGFLALIVAAWLFKPRGRASAIDNSSDAPRPEFASKPPAVTTVEVAVRRPVLPRGRADIIISSLKSGEEPDESWIQGDGRAGEVRLLPYSVQYVPVAGESFANPDGVARQDILKRVMPGAEAFLIPEPTNQFDPNAIAVHIDYGNGDAGQIGYLPRNHNVAGDVAAGKVIAWLSRVVAPREGAPLGAVLYLLIDNR